MKNKANLYIVFGGIPSLYAQINIFIDRTPSYVWVRRAGNFIPELGPDNLMYYHAFKYGFTDFEYITDYYHDIVSKIIEIKKVNHDIKFTVYAEDTRVQFILKPLIEANIYDEIEKFIILSEGNITETFFDSVNFEYFQKTKNYWDKLVTVLKENQFNIDSELAALNNYSPWFSTNNNVEYLLPCNDLVRKKISRMINLPKMNLKELDIEIKYTMLSKAQKMIFFGKDTNTKFNENEKYLIIIGTYDFGSSLLTSKIYIAFIEKLLDDICNYNKIYYKPHPSLAAASKKTELEEYLFNHNIGTISPTLPIEILLWNYKNIDIAGFCSSINSLIDPIRTIAFFGDVFSFSKLLYDDNKFNSKIYNIHLSQNIAGALWNDYNDNSKKIIALEEKLYSLESKFNTMNVKMKKLIRIKYLFMLPIKPLMFIKRSFSKRNKSK